MLYPSVLVEHEKTCVEKQPPLKHKRATYNQVELRIYRPQFAVNILAVKNHVPL